MSRFRRRAALCGVIGLAVALVGGGPLGHDPLGVRLHTQAKSASDRTARNLALTPLDPVSSDGAIADISPSTDHVTSTGPQREAVIQTAPDHFDGEAPKVVAPPAAISPGSVSSQGASKGTWAVVIGINDYPGTGHDLESAVNDANDVAQALDGFGVDADHMIVLRDGQATSRTLLNAVSWLAAHSTTDSVAGFFYAGHVRKTNAGNEEIVTSDGSSVSDRELANALSHVAASRSWVAIAACYGGGFTEVLRPGRVLSAAAGPNDLAYENSGLGRSYMVEYMVRRAMVQGRAPATVQTAFNYAVDQLARDHPGREPVEYDNGDGALDLRPSNATNHPEPPQQDPRPDPTPTTEPPPPSDPPENSEHCRGRGLVHYCTNR